jgi:carbamoylphosphate synthase large subunit
LTRRKSKRTRVGLPAIIRPSFTLGGEGGGIATTRIGIDPNGQELSKQCHGARSDEWMMRSSPPSMNI